MPNIGPLEIAIVVAIALVIFGPKKIPELGRSAGKALREFRGGMSGEDGEPEPKRAVTAAEEVPAAGTASAPPTSATAGARSAPDDQA